MNTVSKRTLFSVLLGIIALGAFFRFYLITEIPLGLYPDEAMNGNNALEAIATGYFKFFYPENNGREGLFINIQALSLRAFGNEPWALRLVSALFGTLTILGIYLVTKELFKNYELRIKNYGNNTNGHNSLFIIPNSSAVALLSAFFLAASYWHLNFSRVGFRAIMVPFFATFALYFLLKGLRTGKISSLVWAGIFTGLGLQTYIAFRFMPFVLSVPILWYLWKWWKERQPAGSPTSSGKSDFLKSTPCSPCAILLFLFITFIVALPIGWYFFQNPQDFFGRGGQVSVFSAESPLAEFIKSNIATLGMFFWNGDCNWRHNFNCQPQLHLLTAFFFTIGVLTIIRHLFTTSYKLQATSLLAWFVFMTLPATLTREGLPHALRAIGMIPPVMIFAGLAAWHSMGWLLEWFEKNKIKWPEYTAQLSRIQREMVIFFVFLLFLIPLATYKDYFIRWANSPDAYFAFATDILHAGEYLRGLPQDTKKYVMVNLSGEEVRGIPMPAQTVMFATNTFREEKQKEKNIYYLTPKNWGDDLKFDVAEKTVIVFLDGKDLKLISAVRNKFPQFKAWVPGDFTILKSPNVPD